MVDFLAVGAGAEEVHFAQHVHVRDFQLQHRRHCAQHSRKKFRWVIDKLGIDNVDPADIVAEPRKRANDLLHNRKMGVDFDLARTVDNQIVITIFSKFFVQPIDVVDQESVDAVWLEGHQVVSGSNRLHAVNKPSVGA